MLNALKSLYKAFYSSEYYINLAGNKKETGFMLVTAQAIIMMILLAGLAIPHAPAIYDKIAYLTDQMPNMTFKDYQMSIEQPSPFSVPLLKEKTDSPKLVIDVGYVDTDIEHIRKRMADDGALVFLTRDYMAAVKEDAHTIESIKEMPPIQINMFKDNELFKELSMNKQDWREMVNNAVYLGVPVMLFATFLGVFITISIYVFIRSVVILLMSFMINLRIGFKGAFRVSAATSAPANTLIAINFLPKIIIPEPVLWITWALYAMYALTCIKRANTTKEIN